LDGGECGVGHAVGFGVTLEGVDCAEGGGGWAVLFDGVGFHVGFLFFVWVAVLAEVSAAATAVHGHVHVYSAWSGGRWIAVVGLVLVLEAAGHGRGDRHAVLSVVLVPWLHCCWG